MLGGEGAVESADFLGKKPVIKKIVGLPQWTNVAKLFPAGRT